MGSVVAVIHAKGESTRLPGKNLKLLGDIPLFCHAILNARATKEVDLVVIDSDDDEILRIGSSYWARPLKRPLELATNDATGDDLAYWQASNFSESDIILQVVPTSPFVRPETIDNAIKSLRSQEVNSVVGCRKEALYTWVDGRPSYILNGEIPNSFELATTTYETTGLYINRTKRVLETKKRIDSNSCLPIYLSKLEAIDINTEEDFMFAEAVWKQIQ